MNENKIYLYDIIDDLFKKITRIQSKREELIHESAELSHSLTLTQSEFDQLKEDELYQFINLSQSKCDQLVKKGNQIDIEINKIFTESKDHLNIIENMEISSI